MFVLLLLASSKLPCEAYNNSYKFCSYALVARDNLCYSFEMVCVFHICN